MGHEERKWGKWMTLWCWPCSCSLPCMFLLIAKWASVNESGVGFVFSEACILRANHTKTPAIQMHLSEWVYAFDWTWCRAHTHLLLHWHQAGKILVFELNKWTFVKWIYIRNMLTIVASSAFTLSLCLCCLFGCFFSGSNANANDSAWLLIASRDKLATYHLYAWVCVFFARCVSFVLLHRDIRSILLLWTIVYMVFTLICFCCFNSRIWCFPHYKHSTSEGVCWFYSKFNIIFKRRCSFFIFFVVVVAFCSTFPFVVCAEVATCVFVHICNLNCW